jgi:hypothetical protein
VSSKGLRFLQFLQFYDNAWTIFQLRGKLINKYPCAALEFSSVLVYDKKRCTPYNSKEVSAWTPK